MLVHVGLDSIRDYFMDICEPNLEMECDSGWTRLIFNLLKETRKVLKKKGLIGKVKVIQIKEKYGVLRMHLNEHIPEVYKFIATYERLSCRVCEVCGASKGKNVKPRKIAHRAIIKTLCRDCYPKMKEKLK